MRVEYAELSLKGGRETNQDRICVAVAEDAALLIACDGMGGHAEGERAAEIAQRTVVERFWHTPQPVLDPLGFLHLSLGAAHVGVVTLGLHAAARDAAARDLRAVPGAAALCLLGARGRQPRVSRARRPGA